jgi:FkbM family methyltransferase
MDMTDYRSQCGQDSFVDHYLREMRDGVFVEAGAHDGLCFSNTAFLEQVRGWTGLCVEPHPDTFKELQANRKCQVLNAALGMENSKAERFIKVTDGCSGCSALWEVMNEIRLEALMAKHGGTKSEIMVPVYRTQDALDLCGITHIDYFSLDTDGNEEDVIDGIDWTRTQIRVMTVENTENDSGLRVKMARMGMKFLTRLQWDDVFVRTELMTL